MVLLYACSSLIDNGLQNMCLTEMWQLGYWQTIESTIPLDLNGKRKRDYNRQASVSEPMLYFESINCLGECSYVVEESPSIQQNMLVGTTQAKGKVLHLKSLDKF
jgi:hypothetical protein